MKRLGLILIFFVSSNLSIAQSYPTDSVIRVAKSYLQEAVGDELISYFELHPGSWYTYISNAGKEKYVKFSKSKNTKGKFVQSKHIWFKLNHPKFQHNLSNSDKIITVHVDSNLNLMDTIQINKIPKFLLDNQLSEWISEEDLDNIALNSFKRKPLQAFCKTLYFDRDKNEYVFIIYNFIENLDGFSNLEIIEIEPYSGKVKNSYFSNTSFFEKQLRTCW